jgi:hypothetical protein
MKLFCSFAIHLEGGRRFARALTATVALASTWVVGPASLIASTSTAPVPTKGIASVDVTSYQALPQYQPRHAVLKSASSLHTFERILLADHISLRAHPTSSLGCAGGTQYRAVLVYTEGHRVSLYAYDCANSITGNMAGDVRLFVGYLALMAG